MRPAADIVVIVENKDENTSDQQEIVNQTTVPSSSSTSTTTTTSTTTLPKSIVSTPVAKYNQEEILQKTVQIVVNDCLSNDQESTSFTGLGSGVLVSSSGHNPSTFIIIILLKTANYSFS